MPDHPEAAATLRRAVQELYKVFGHYRGASNWDDAMDNLPPERASRPDRLPVKELSREDVEYFFHHAVCLGEPRHRLKDELKATRYFLPKVFEFNSREGWPVDRLHCYVCNWWFIGEKMRHTAWHSWPTEQRNPIVSWFGAWLDAVLLYGVMPPTADHRYGGRAPANRTPATWVGAVAELDLETAGFMPRLESVAGSHLLGFAETLTRTRLYHTTGKGFFWESNDPCRQQPLADWLLSGKTADQLEESFFDCDDPPTAKRISETLELLEGIKASSAPGRNN